MSSSKWSGRGWVAWLAVPLVVVAVLGTGVAGRIATDAGGRALEASSLSSARRWMEASVWLGGGNDARLALAEVARAGGSVHGIRKALRGVRLSGLHGAEETARFARLRAFAANQSLARRQALAWARFAHLQASASGNQRLQLGTMVDLAVVLFRDFDRHREARVLLERALEIADPMAPATTIAEIELRLGDVIWWYTRDAKAVAERHWRSARARVRSVRDARGLGRAHQRLAEIAIDAGDLQTAARRLGRAGELHRASGDRGTHCKTLALEAVVASQRGEYDTAATRLRESKAEAEALGHLRCRRRVAGLEADRALRWGRFDAAIGHLTSMVDGESSSLHRSWVLTLLGHAQLGAGAHAQALDRYRQADEVLGSLPAPRLRAQHALMRAGVLRELGDLDAADQVLSHAERLSRAIDDRVELLHVRLVQAGLAQQQGRPMRMLDRLAAAADLETELLHTDVRLLDANQNVHAHRLLVDLLRGSCSGVETPVCRRAAKVLFRFVEQQRFRAHRSLLTAADGRRARLASVEDVQASLEPGARLVVYSAAHERLAALVVGSDRLWVVPLDASRRDVDARVRLLRRLLDTGSDERTGSDDWRPVARALDRDLVAPLRTAGALTGATTLGIVPTAPFDALPFAALARDSQAGLRFLVEDVSLFFTPSASVYVASRTRPSRSGGTSLVVGIGRHGGDWQPLPSAVEEARAVAARLGGGLLLDAAATETAIRAQLESASLVHIATHAHTDRRRPAASYVRLRGDAANDGRLTVEEIKVLRLEAELVALSSCETGFSRPLRGSDLAERDRTGLVEAFLEAGARRVLASVQPVGDRTTGALMEAFYAARPQLSDVEALARAQRHLLHSTDPVLRHPAAWGPFQLIGDPG